MMTDPIADLLTRVRNALQMRHSQVALPHSNLKEEVVALMKKEGYLRGFEVVGEGTKKMIVMELKYLRDGRSAIQTLKRVSKPSCRLYRGYEKLAAKRSEWGMRIVTTSAGLLTDSEAIAKKMGGEVLLEVW